MSQFTIYGLDEITAIDRLGIGVFDGVHLGHQEIINQCDAILTFAPHPDIFLGKNPHLKCLTLANERAYYVPQQLILTFNTHVSQLSPQAFLDEIIVGKIHPKRIMVGYDFKFGHKGQGSLDFLRSWASQHDISITETPPILDASGDPIKSSRIRDALGTDFNQSIAWLGHSYLMIGTVIKGDNRGASLGYPTANIAVNETKLIPGNGVYKATVQYHNQDYPSILYIGSKPTFDGQEHSIEVHLLDVSLDLYDKELHVFLEHKIREEQHFSSETALKDQIAADIQACLHIDH